MPLLPRAVVRAVICPFLLALPLLLLPSAAQGEELCDPSFEDCRERLLRLIRAETVGIDVAFWFMEDARYTSELIRKHQAGVPVRVLVDPSANPTYPLNADRIAELRNAGIPMRRRNASGILHWKMLLFDGQNTVQFSGANYSPWALRPVEPYVNYTDEAIYFATDPHVVNSFRTKYDALWTATSGYVDYANITGPLTRRYPDVNVKDAELNFPPQESFRSRAVARYDAETVGIDVTMFRITDRAHTDAMIRALNRGVRVRLYTEPGQYRDPTRLWHSWNVDRLYMAGAEIRHRAHAGSNHQKSILLYGQRLTIFGSSNWTSSSSSSQEEHNYFTRKGWFFDWFVQNFERKWNNSTGIEETIPFVPLPPGRPSYQGLPNGATGVATSGVTLRWHGGSWAHEYDVHFGTTADPPLLQARLELGPSETPADVKEFALPALHPGTTYYWRIVSRTMADQRSAGAVFSFTTAGMPPAPAATTQVGNGDIVLHAHRAELSGAWTRVGDGTAAGGVRVHHPDAGVAKLDAPLATPVHYFDLTFTARADTPYRLWLRMRAQNNHWANESVFAQFSGTVDGAGAPVWRIGTTSGTTVNLEDCSGCGVSGWGWQDNGWGANVLGPVVRFATGGQQTIRIQTREDGVSIDQIVLSPDTWLSTAPGPLKNDATILPEADGEGSAPPPVPVTVLRQPYLQQVTSTGAYVVWTTREAGPAAVRMAGPAGFTTTAAGESTLFPAAVTGAGADYYQHVVRVAGLSPATSYAYDIVVDGYDANPGTDTLVTAPEPGTGAVSFVAFGDSGTGSAEQHQISALIQAGAFDFAMHSGDVAYGTATGLGGATYATMEDWFFAVYRNWLRHTPMFPSMGNHDSRSANGHGRPYRDMFVLPEHAATPVYPDHAERFYSFDYGPVHVVVLDTELAFQDAGRRAAQLEWLRQDLEATTAPWKLALFHRSPYSAGGEHGSDLAVREVFSPVFEAYGVQLVLSGHEHIYQRTVPLNGVTYVVTGGGGGPLYPALTDTWTASSHSRHHYVRGAADGCALTLEAVGIDGSVFDTVTLSRCGPSADTQAPAVALTAPPAGATVSGDVPVTIEATDDTGVVRVELLVDGAVAATVPGPPYETRWRSTTVADGTRTLSARAYDAAGNIGTAPEVVVQVRNAPTATGDIVLYASEAAVVSGGWRRQQDGTAAGGWSLRHPDAGAPKRTAALASPVDFFELTFEAQAGVPYHLWVRGKADANSWANDSVFVQFTNVDGMAIGTTVAAEVNIEDCSGCRLAGWGWQDNGWGTGVLGPHIVFTAGGRQTIRIQTREDGLAIDQVLLSPSRFLTTSPGALKNDGTIYPATGTAPPPPDTTPPAVSIVSPSDGSAVSGIVTVTVSATDDVGVTEVELRVNGVPVGTRTAEPFTFSWDTSGLPEGVHQLQATARDAASNAGTSGDVTVIVDRSAPASREIVLYAAHATAVQGSWRMEADRSAALQTAVRHPDAGAPKRSRPLEAPVDYFELTFTAEAGVAYHLWIRSKADRNSWANDSVFVQFTNVAAYGIGTSAAAEVNMEDCSGCGLSGWGWQDNGWGVGVMGPDIVFTTSGTQTIRVQTREDGLSIDQIVLSPDRYFRSSPGALKNDVTIVPQP